MLIIFCIVLTLLLVSSIIVLIKEKKDHSGNLDTLESLVENIEAELKEKDETISFLEQISTKLASQLQIFENALSTQIVDRSNEVGSPPPSGAYHTLFTPTGNGKIMMVYLCLDTGHIARWHFHSPEALEEEGKRFIKTAEEARQGNLPDVPFMSNIPIGSNGVLH